jgi:ABC-type glycerol-3-phosphate transport system substrate-binding protein
MRMTSSEILAGGETKLILENRALFTFGGIWYAKNMRQMEADFGILPYPKYTEEQKEYCPSTSPLFLSLTTVPSTNTDREEIGVFLEAFAYYGYTDVRPAFYDLLLQGKLVRDEASGEMLDYIFEKRFYDTGSILNFNNFSHNVISLTNSFSQNISSYIAANLPAAEKALEDFTAKLAEGE